MINNDEKLIEEMIRAVKSNGNISNWKKDRKLSPIVNLISSLNSIPKTSIPGFDFSRVRNQILDRISLPKMEEAKSYTKAFRLVFAGMGSLMIIISLTVSTAVAALQSDPGSAIYPLKKVVENVQLKFASDEEKGALQLKFALNRAEEIQSVIEKQEQGQITQEEAQKIVATTVQDLQKSTTAAASAAKQPKVATKLADLSDKLKAASIHTEGDVKIEIEKAVQSTKISQEEAIKNIENAGIKVEDKPIIDNSISAQGKLTAVTETSLSIGTAKFTITKDTKYEGIDSKDLTIGQLVDISGEIKDNKTYADKVTLIAETKIQDITESPTTEDPQ